VGRLLGNPFPDIAAECLKEFTQESWIFVYLTQRTRAHDTNLLEQSVAHTHEEEDESEKKRENRRNSVLLNRMNNWNE
jgi:hypothetical protein